jgi:hypothetical protein
VHYLEVFTLLLDTITRNCQAWRHGSFIIRRWKRKDGRSGTATFETGLSIIALKAVKFFV